MDKYAEQAEKEDVFVNDDEPIHEEEVEEAKVIIAKLHPMMNTHFHHVLPTLGKMCKCCFFCKENRADRMQEMKKMLEEEREEHDQKIDSVFDEYKIDFTGKGPDLTRSQKIINTEEFEEDDPFNNLGYGWTAYFQTLHIFTWLFLILTIIMIPVYYFYASRHGLELVSRGTYNSFIFMGNLGFNKAVCISSYVSLQAAAPATLQCEVGTMTDVKFSGIIPILDVKPTWEAISYGYCNDPYSTNIGNDKPEQVPTGTAGCTETFLDSTSLTTGFHDKCFDQHKCSFQIHDYIDMSAGTATSKTSCTTGTAKVYMQYFCTEKPKTLDEKRQAGLVVASISCVAGLVFMTVIFYLKKTVSLNFQMWDLQTLTASDFTCEITITNDMWTKFNVELGQHAQLPKGGAAPDHTDVKLPVVTFEAFLEIKMSEKLNALPKINEDIPIRIANITFGFDNAEMLDLLTQRGSLITAGKLEKLPPLNEKIDQICKDKKTEIIRPVAAFITFEHQEGKDRALMYFSGKNNSEGESTDIEEAQGLMSSQQNAQMLGQALRCQQAPEPSEILWHNRHVTIRQQNFRKIWVFVACFIFLLGMFVLFSVMKAASIKNMFRYPSTVNCKAVQSTFTNEQGVTNVAAYEEYAITDSELTYMRQGSGILQCYCFEYGAFNPPKGSTCYTYFTQQAGGYAIGESVTVAITVVNTIIRTLCIMMIKMVGYHTETGEIAAITMTIFIATFFNTGVLLLLADADLSQVSFLGWIPLNGPFPDLTEQWYIVIAPSMVMTMAINAVYPYIDFGISFGTLVLFRCLDQGFSTYLCCKKEKTTKCKTIQAYVNIYAGPQHAMSYKYSAILLTTYVTMMYGVALPVLFPIAAFTFFNYYIVDRFLVAYYYRKPPIYDDKLTRTALETMKFSPLLLFFFGYWTLGNMQVFNDRVVALVNSGIPLTTEHTAEPQANQSLPLFIMGCIVTIGFIATSCCRSCLIKMGLSPDDHVELVDEKCGSYYQCVPLSERKRWLAQEVHATKTLGISSMGKSTEDKLRTSNSSFKTIKNAPNYEILSNIKYCQAFQFTPIDMCDTQEEQSISDMITRVLFMGYAKPGFQDFSFKRILSKRGNRRAQLAKQKEKFAALKAKKAAKKVEESETFDVSNNE